MEEVVRAYYDNYKGAIMSLLLVTGLWPDDAKQSRVLRTILAALVIVVLTTLILLVLNFTVHNARNIFGLVAGISSIISFGSAYIKEIVILVFWRDVKDLKCGLSTLFEEDLKVARNRSYLLHYYPAFYRFFRVHYYSAAGFVVFGTCTTLWAAIHGKYVRTFAIRVPFDYVPGDSLHWMIFVFEMISSVYLATISIGVDTLFGLFAFHMVGQLRLLSHRFRSLKPGENYKRQLKECIDRHCQLIYYKNRINKVFGLVSVWLAISSAVIICSIIFQLTQGKNVSLFKLIFCIDYIASKLLQAYIYARYGNTITVESEKCVESIYHTDWTEFGNVQVMKDIFMVQSQRPMYINAMGLMIVRMDMFVKIARTSISYFCLLRTIEDKLALLVVMWIYKQDVLYLSHGLTNVYEKDLEIAEYRPHLLAYYHAFYRFFKAHYYYFSAILLFGMSVPIIAAYHGGAARLYPVHPPFRYEPGGARHWMIFAFEVVSGVYAVTVTVGCDSLFGLYALNLVGEMRLLTHRFRNLKSGKYYRIELKECVDRHNLLMESKGVMQRLFGVMSVLLAVTTAVIVCANIFTLTLSKTIPTYKAAFLIDYTVAKLFQAYMFSWFGNCITVESETCLNAIYDAKWAGSGDMRLMNDILIIQSQSPMYFETMGIMKVRLDMFSKILNTSISYYFLLKTVAEKLS